MIELQDRPPSSAPAAPEKVADTQSTGAPAMALVDRKAPATNSVVSSARTEGTAGGSCTLNINSLPASSLMLDGKPIGNTPKAGVSASSGSHTVVFVHPEHGRKSQTVTCRTGETKTVIGRLND